MTFKAVAFGRDGLTGDSAFTVDFFHAEGNETFAELRQEWLHMMGEDDEPVEEPVEFHLVEAKVADALENAPFSVGSDSAFYALNHALKSLAQTLAVKTIRA
jgi:hypothetical protein